VLRTPHMRTTLWVYSISSLLQGFILILRRRCPRSISSFQSAFASRPSRSSVPQPPSHSQPANNLDLGSARVFIGDLHSTTCIPLLRDLFTPESESSISLVERSCSLTIKKVVFPRRQDPLRHWLRPGNPRSRSSALVVLSPL